MPWAAQGTVGDYWTLLKPRVMSLVIFTALAGLVAASSDIHPWLALVALLAIAVGAGASGALNMWYDADIDALMARTANRPVPRGAILPGEALGFGLALAVGSVLVLGLLVNIVAAALLAFTIFFYVVIYTMWLKRSTPQNIVIGGAAGAFPPMIGWAAATGSVDARLDRAVPHHLHVDAAAFLGLALFREDDYARAGVPMLPDVAGASETRRQILLYSLILVPVTFLPSLLGTAGSLYTVATALLGVAFLWHALVRVPLARRRYGAARLPAPLRLLDPLSLRDFRPYHRRARAGRGAFPTGFRMSPAMRPETVFARGHGAPPQAFHRAGVGAARPGGPVLRDHCRPAWRRCRLEVVLTCRAVPVTPNSAKNRKVALMSAVLVVGMVGLAYASVPLYRLFCQVTGFGGTTQRAEVAPEKTVDRRMTIRFDANTAGSLPWTFEPVQRSLDVKVGEEKFAYYRATNRSDQPSPAPPYSM